MREIPVGKNGLVAVIDAALAYDAAARELFGEFALLNLPSLSAGSQVHSSHPDVNRSGLNASAMRARTREANGNPQSWRTRWRRRV